MKKWVGILILFLGLIVVLGLTGQITNLLPLASFKPADIVVDAKKPLGVLPRPWPNLAQGGEESSGMIEKTVAKVKPLKPDYIRLDHLFDFYQTISKENGRIVFNWTGLDQEVNAILQTGAKPFLALSYLPDGYDLTDWQIIINATINHYSGKNQKNISDVYYEVWNEPDLFGGYKVYGEKSYLDLYRRAAQGAIQASNTQPFKFGGPATTGMYKNWMEGLFKLVTAESLPLDFISWHRYSRDPKDFINDVELISRLISQYPGLVRAERIISEWGFDPKNHSGYDNNFSVAHGFATIKAMLNRAQKMFLFEIKDGKDPEGKPFWGRWGLLTHQDSGLQEKPRYHLLLWLNELGDTRLLLTGENNSIQGLAAKKDTSIQLYLVNYHSGTGRTETVPVTFKNLENGAYRLTRENFGGQPQTSQISPINNTFALQVPLAANQLTRLTLTPDNR